MTVLVTPTGVHNLPVELLAQIFESLVASLTVQWDHTYSKCQRQYFCRIGHSLGTLINPYQWIRITAVCHYWRDVALSTFSLWNMVVPSSKPTVDAMLRRSSIRLDPSISIEARLESEHQEEIDTFNYLISLRPQISSMNLVIDREGLEQISQSMSQINPSSLERLSLVYDRHGAVLSSIPNFHFPSLVSFSASGISLRALKPFLLPSLRSLSIYFVSDRCRYQLPELLDLLETMPMLEDLTLVGALQTTIPSSVHRLDVIDGRSAVFSHLKSLHISDYGITVASFLKHVTLVKPAKLFLRLTAFFTEQEIRLALNGLQAFIVHVVEQGWGAPIKAISLQSDDEGQLKFESWIRLPRPTEAADLAITLECGRQSLLRTISGLLEVVSPDPETLDSVSVSGVVSSDMLRSINPLLPLRAS